jgi:hypothetical protein
LQSVTPFEEGGDDDEELAALHARRLDVLYVTANRDDTPGAGALKDEQGDVDEPAATTSQSSLAGDGMNSSTVTPLQLLYGVMEAGIKYRYPDILTRPSGGHVRQTLLALKHFADKGDRDGYVEALMDLPEAITYASGA